jgi:hypothetical protein
MIYKEKVFWSLFEPIGISLWGRAFRKGGKGFFTDLSTSFVENSAGTLKSPLA